MISHCRPPSINCTSFECHLITLVAVRDGVSLTPTADSTPLPPSWAQLKQLEQSTGLAELCGRKCAGARKKGATSCPRI